MSSEKKVLKTCAALWIAPVNTIYRVGFGRRKTDTLHCPWLHHSVLCSIHFTAERGTALRRWKAPSISLIVWQGQFISAHSPSSDRNQLTHCLAYPTQGGSLQLLQLSAFFQSRTSFFLELCFFFPISRLMKQCHSIRAFYYGLSQKAAVTWFSPPPPTFSHFCMLIPINRIWWYWR